MNDELAMKLMVIDGVHNRKVDAASFLVNEDYFYIDLFDLVCTELGVPEDNWAEMCEKHDEDAMPPEAYCRDYLFDKWYDLRNVEDGPAQFVQLAREQATLARERRSGE